MRVRAVKRGFAGQSLKEEGTVFDIDEAQFVSVKDGGWMERVSAEIDPTGPVVEPGAETLSGPGPEAAAAPTPESSAERVMAESQAQADDDA